MLLNQLSANIKNAVDDNCFRLFHGRGHAFEGLEHVNIDWYAPVVVVTLYKEDTTSLLADIQQFIIQHLPLCRSIQVQHRYQSLAPFTLLWGEEIFSTVCQENGLKYHIELGKSQNTGLFLDMANGRQWVKENAEHKTVLNLFAYTCAFSVAAIAGKADKVVNIDMAKNTLTKGRENHRLNAHDLKKVHFEGVDIFKSYNRLKKHGPYQLLICDPPSFQKGSVNIERDYKKIISRLPQWLDQQADVLLCLNSPDLDEEFLLAEVARECPNCQFQYKIDNPEVFVEAVKGKGLKALYFRYKA
ncbi:class I SAM-dependent methyltransferase [Thalassotalea marina]|uniref:Methyltransferase n=1 Tax=Thalassotalea marina TaxID=1673741 RepID=A0A919BA33_9GAMM|nr:class I SAM-dependent methyltransferase [Thalassotalea marina]GHF78161.1 methyltransferase [Thalassotalea marina]